MISSEHGRLPLVPIDRPQNWFARLLCWAAQRRYGKVPMALRVCYGRMPSMAVLSVVITVIKARYLKLEPELRFLLPIAISMRAGCTFCADLMQAEALLSRMSSQRFTELLDFEASASFSAREKAALAYAAALQRSLHVDDETFGRLQAHFDEREQIEIVWLCATERYYNAMALPLRIGRDDLALRHAQAKP